MKPLIILAGGFGSRLRASVSDVPKPLAPVDGSPFLRYLIDHWIDQGVRDFVFLLHYEAEKIEFMLAEMAESGLFKESTVRTIIEDSPLGTGGAISNAVNQLELSGSFLVVNADTWLGTGIRELAQSSPCAIGTIKVQNSERYGSVGIDRDKIFSFQEKQISKGEGYINSGLYHLSPSIFEDHEGGASFSLEESVLPELARTGKLYSVQLDTDFIDIGIPADYLRFCSWMERGRVDGL